MLELALAPHLPKLLERLAERRGLDLRDYRAETIEDGVRARVVATRCADGAAYVELLDRDSSELHLLVEALLVSSTSFFRDPAVFAALGEEVAPAIAAGLGSKTALRAWSIGCATGEEAWSLAMVLEEALRPFARKFTLLATDIDERALATARRGTYGSDLADGIPPAHRTQWTAPAPDGVGIRAELHAPVRFALHDVMGTRLAPSEAVVASFHVALMRNVLIYLDRRLQQKVLERVATVLEPGGALVLGHVETMPPALADRLRPWPTLPPELRIFQRRV